MSSTIEFKRCMKCMHAVRFAELLFCSTMTLAPSIVGTHAQRRSPAHEFLCATT